jgi:hypothetical protein
MMGGLAERTSGGLGTELRGDVASVIGEGPSRGDS